ncbi:MAG: DMT family transporter [Pseudobdellovibrionaceae bacterium]
MTESKKNRLLFIAAVLQIIWGLVPSASKFVIDEIPIELYIAIRWTIAGTIFTLFVLLMKSWRPISLRSFSLVSMLGILGYGLASLATLYGLKIGGVTNFALMGALSPAITSFIAILLLKERPQRLFFIALPLSIAGLLILVIGKYQISSVSVAGASAACIIGGAILEALVFVFSKKFKTQMTTTQYLATAQMAAATLMWILQLTVFHQIDSIALLTARGLTAAIFVSVVACVLCYAVLYWLLNFIDGHRLSLFDGFHALSATMFAYIFFQEKLTPLMLVGGTLILFGLVVGNLPKKISEDSPE